MWLTTPRMLMVVGLLAGLTALVASGETSGALAPEHARIFYIGACLVVLALIVVRARARWNDWKRRQLERP